MCSAKFTKLGYNIVNNNNNLNNNNIIYFTKYSKLKNKSFGRVKKKNKKTKQKTIFKITVNSFCCLLALLKNFSKVHQVLEALRLQRRCQGNMVMAPLVVHAAACWEWTEGEQCVLRQRVKVHQGRAHCCSCYIGFHWVGGLGGCPVHPLVGQGASPPAGLVGYLLQQPPDS